MPKFACRCGYVMNLSNGSPDFELALIPESSIQKIAERLDETEHLGSSSFFYHLDKERATVYRCPSCARIHVDRGDGLFDSFVPERFVGNDI